MDALTARGHRVMPRREGFVESFFGRPSGIVVDPASGAMRGGVEPYRAGTAIGF